MQSLWDIDVALFKTIHLGLRSEVTDPFVLWFADTGLWHVQAGALALPIIRNIRQNWLRPLMAVAIFLLVGFFSDNVKNPVLTIAALVPLAAVFTVLKPKEAWCALICCSASGLLVLLNKVTIGRWRPSNLDFARPIEPIYNNASFPSGHATTTFAIAFALLLYLWGTPRVKIAWWVFVWAVLMGLNRVICGVHFPSDSLGGALFALIITMVCFAIGKATGWLQGPQESAV